MPETSGLDLANARTTYEEVLRIREAKLGAEHKETLATKGNLATVVIKQGDLGCARELYEAVIQAQEDTLGAEHPDTLTMKGDLAMVMKDLQAALEAMEAVIRADELKLGPEHPDTQHRKGMLGLVLQELAGVAEDNGERAEAVALYCRAADMFEPEYGKDDGDVVECRAKVRELS